MTSGICLSQDTSAIDKSTFKKLFTEANLEMMENSNDTALHTFLLLHKLRPTNANVNYKIGQLYLRSFSEKAKAIDFFESAIPYATSAYSDNNPMETHCPELVYYYLGEAYHLAYRFDEAINMFETFRKSINQKDIATMKDIHRKENMCTTAKELVKSPIKCNITNLGDNVNSSYPDYGAVITADESSIFFTSRRYNVETAYDANAAPNRGMYYEDIWTSNKNLDGSWSKATALGPEINTPYNEAVVGISPDGQQLL
ncbi:MAG TPA: hypothetical protein VII99_00390, partial [Bacteroidia bacterium]